VARGARHGENQLAKTVSRETQHVVSSRTRKLGSGRQLSRLCVCASPPRALLLSAVELRNIVETRAL
jgi:hypothetical protein